jgi:hypothetical protein
MTESYEPKVLCTARSAPRPPGPTEAGGLSLEILKDCHLRVGVLPRLSMSDIGLLDFHGGPEGDIIG